MGAVHAYITQRGGSPMEISRVAALTARRLDRVRRGGISAVVVAGTDTIPAQLLRLTVRVIDLHSMTP